MNEQKVTLMSCFEEAHHALVMAARVAHLENHQESKNISKLIDVLEDIIIKVSCKKS